MAGRAYGDARGPLEPLGVRSPRSLARPTQGGWATKKSRPRPEGLQTARLDQETGGVLLSQALSSQVPSALRGLTALFGMGRGVSPSLKPPERLERPSLPVLQNCTAPHRVPLAPLPRH